MAYDPLPPPEYVTGTGQALVHVHDPSRCQGRWCVIHNPMPGPWDAWPTHWRSDRGIMERVCPHGTGHPVAEDYGRVSGWELVHGCCECPCAPSNYYDDGS